MNLEIKKVETRKDNVKQPRLAEAGIIPKINSSILLIGSSGSGKSTLCQNLVEDKRFYKGYFDHRFLISPTGLADDVQKELNIPIDCVYTDLKQAVPALELIQKIQSSQIEKLGPEKASKILVIYDDCVGDTAFMREPCFVKSFLACRHFNMTTILCSQHYRRVPRVCRLQANYLAFFALSNIECEVLAEEHAPPGLHKKDFIELINDTLKEPYSFLGINMKAPWATRFRRNLGELINLEYYKKIK